MRRARRLIVRLDRADRAGVVVTLPPRVSRSEALDFVEEIVGLDRGAPGAQPSGSTFARRSRNSHSRRAAGASRMAGTRRGLVSADRCGRHRRSGRCCPSQAPPDRLAESARRSAIFSRRPNSMRSRWVSASAAFRCATRRAAGAHARPTAASSYSWRLILAPPFVLDYVAAHEVAHLKHMNHGTRFWRLVLTHCPHAGARQDLAQAAWRELHAYALATC